MVKVLVMKWVQEETLEGQLGYRLLHKHQEMSVQIFSLFIGLLRKGYYFLCVFIFFNLILLFY